MIFLGIFIFMGFGFFNFYFNKILVRINLSKILNNYVINMNNECPVDINTELKMEQVSFIAPKIVVYKNRLINYNKDSLNIVKLEENLSQIVFEDLENSKSLAKLRNMDVIFEYHYFDKDWEELFLLRVIYNTPLVLISNE